MVTRPMSDFKPDTDPEIWYAHAPVELDCTVRDSPVFKSLIVTVAPGTTAPEESFTVPARSPVVVVWAGNSAQKASASATRIVTAEDFVPIRMLPFFQNRISHHQPVSTGQNILVKMPNAETNRWGILGRFRRDYKSIPAKFRIAG